MDNGFDSFCEVASQNNTFNAPNNVSQRSIYGNPEVSGLTAGEILIRNTAKVRYLKSMGNCKKKYEPFDPLVASSPMILYWEPANLSVSNHCVPTYAVNPKTIENDPVMMKLLKKPTIAMDILKNIYMTMKFDQTLKDLDGTKLGLFFKNNEKYFSK